MQKKWASAKTCLASRLAQDTGGCNFPTEAIFLFSNEFHKNNKQLQIFDRDNFVKFLWISLKKYLTRKCLYVKSHVIKILFITIIRINSSVLSGQHLHNYFRDCQSWILAMPFTQNREGWLSFWLEFAVVVNIALKKRTRPNRLKRLLFFWYFFKIAAERHTLFLFFCVHMYMWVNWGPHFWPPFSSLVSILFSTFPQFFWLFSWFSFHAHV